MNIEQFETTLSSAVLPAELAATLDVTSAKYLGRWEQLVSTTNWEKGRIILEWRQALVEQGAPAQHYSDEAWSRRCGQVTGQHTGRLRRVFERFSNVRDSFPSLSWSHFQAALDWEDAEMWLEGAVQNEWSIADMRGQRREAFGGDPSLQTADTEDVSAELDEDYAPLVASGAAQIQVPLGNEDGHSPTVANGAADQAEVEFTSGDYDSTFDSVDGVAFDAANPLAAPAPFADLSELPADLSEAFEQFKLVILRHKLAGWAEVSSGDVLAALDALRQMAMASAG